MSIFKVAYEPKIGVLTKSYIQNNIPASLTSKDGTSNQYSLDFILNKIEEDQIEIPQDDLKHLKELSYKEKVSYIEFILISILH